MAVRFGRSPALVRGAQRCLPAGAATRAARPKNRTAAAFATLSGTQRQTLAGMGIKLIVCDMAGTTVEEYGIVYATLREAMMSHGLKVSEDEMHPWHGGKCSRSLCVFFEASKRSGCTAAKGEVLRFFVDRQPEAGVSPEVIDGTFEDMIKAAYAREGSTSLIVPKLPQWIARCQSAGIQVALNTGYPKEIQAGLLKGLGLDGMVDHWISAYEVAKGRPYPYMVHRVMEQAGVQDVSAVAKFGDTVNDIREGRNAGCGLVVGVLSGADGALALYEAGADIVVPDVTHVEPGMLSEFAAKHLAYQELQVSQEQQGLEEVQALLSKQVTLEAALPLAGRKISLGA